jgi:hypothetical protein
MLENKMLQHKQNEACGNSAAGTHKSQPKEERVGLVRMQEQPMPEEVLHLFRRRKGLSR